MITISTISDLPNVPAVYALYSGKGRSLHVAYVGVAKRLKKRIERHLVRHISSVTSGLSAAMLDPEKVTEVHWWEHDGFRDRSVLEAAELVAFDVLNPALRSRRAVPAEVQQRYDDEIFREEMRVLFQSQPAGRLSILTLQDALDRVDALEERVRALESLVETLREKQGK